MLFCTYGNTLGRCMRAARVVGEMPERHLCRLKASRVLAGAIPRPLRRAAGAEQHWCNLHTISLGGQGSQGRAISEVATWPHERRFKNDTGAAGWSAH